MASSTSQASVLEHPSAPMHLKVGKTMLVTVVPLMPLMSTVPLQVAMAQAGILGGAALRTTLPKGTLRSLRAVLAAGAPMKPWNLC